MPTPILCDSPRDSWVDRRGLRGQLKCTLLAAGLGRRLEPLTARHLPKPLMPLGGKTPLAEIWVRRMVRSGITDISMNLCVHADTIESYFQDGSAFGAAISYVKEATPSGTLGGVCKQALGRTAKNVGEPTPILQEAFAGTTIIAPSGDTVTNFDVDLLEQMFDIHKQSGASLTMVLTPVPWDRRKDFGTVVLDQAQARSGMISRSGRICEFREKDGNSPSNLNNASIYMIEMDLLRELDALRTPARLDVERPFYDFGKHVFPAMLGQLPNFALSRRHLLWGIEYDGAWFDVGQKRDYLDVNRRLLDGELEVDLPYTRCDWGYMGTNLTGDLSQVKIIPPAIIGNDCIIRAGTTVGPHAIVGDGWTLEPDAVISNSVLWERYPYLEESGQTTPLSERRQIDLHRVGPGVRIAGSIVAGGELTGDVVDSTVHVSNTGELVIVPIDFVPAAPRA